MAIGAIVVIGVVKVVLIGYLFSGSDIARRHNPDSAIDVFSLAVGVAGVIDEHCCPKAVDHLSMITGAEEVGYEAVFVAFISFVFGKARAIVLDDRLSFAYATHCVTTGGVN